MRRGGVGWYVRGAGLPMTRQITLCAPDNPPCLPYVLITICEMRRFWPDCLSVWSGLAPSSSPGNRAICAINVVSMTSGARRSPWTPITLSVKLSQFIIMPLLCHQQSIREKVNLVWRLFVILNVNLQHFSYLSPRLIFYWARLFTTWESGTTTIEEKKIHFEHRCKVLSIITRITYE